MYKLWCTNFRGFRTSREINQGPGLGFATCHPLRLHRCPRRETWRRESAALNPTGMQAKRLSDSCQSYSQVFAMSSLLKADLSCLGTGFTSLDCSTNNGQSSSIRLLCRPSSSITDGDLPHPQSTKLGPMARQLTGATKWTQLRHRSAFFCVGREWINREPCIRDGLLGYLRSLARPQCWRG
jgi:hypothetical protein